MSNTHQNTEQLATSGLHCDLAELIDWPTALSAPRLAGGHEEVMRAIFGKTSTVVAWFCQDDYQGVVAIAHRLIDGRVVVMTDYYGSCSGCDAWEGANDEDAKKQILDIVNNARVFDSLDSAKTWCSRIDASLNPEQFPFVEARKLWPEASNN